MVRTKLIKHTWVVLVLTLILSGGSVPVFVHAGQGTLAVLPGSLGDGQAALAEPETGECAGIAGALDHQRCYEQEGRYAVVAQQAANCDEISDPRERQRCRNEGNP